MDDRRRAKRIVIKLKAEIVTESQGSNIGYLENLSEEGIYMISVPANPMIDFQPGTTFDLKFQLSSGQKLNLHCKVKWSFKTPPHGLTNSMGLEIIDPPEEYKELLKTL